MLKTYIRSNSTIMYTLEEHEKIKELRNRVKDELVTKEQHEDYFLIRWLRARGMDIDKAEEMLRKSLKWRKENGADTILETEQIPDEFGKRFMYGLFGEDQDSCPIFCLPGGRHDHKYLLESVGHETSLKWNIVLMESVMQMVKETRIRSGKPVHTYHEIIDLEGYSYRSFMYKPAVDFILETQKMFDENYPEVLKSVTVINAPKVFSLLFSVMKPLIPKETLEKVTIFGDNKDEWKEAFVKKGFPMDKIPPNWGGTREGSDEFCSQEPCWTNYPIPLKYFKEVPEADEDGFFSAKIGARDKLELKFPTLNNNESTTVKWIFKTETSDIGFQLSFIAENGSKEEVIIPMNRIEAFKDTQQGSQTWHGKGTFTFLFDNQYSFFRSKTLKYQITLS